ncbi:uncharacterized protein [Spinacia oleracea]|uniref:Uncharacterized protein n=1 Tax=Spinacia oleracea TaxID=3562 RepID=A0ABM3QI41_SPIOL|nr:uncharacterized protein LOC130459584 [Spinacia oleracea]
MSEEEGDTGVIYMLFPTDPFNLVYGEYARRLGANANQIAVFRLNGSVVPSGLLTCQLNLHDGQTLVVRGLVQGLNVNTHMCTFFVRAMVDWYPGWFVKAAFNAPLWTVFYDWAILLGVQPAMVKMFRNFDQLDKNLTIRGAGIQNWCTLFACLEQD